MNTKIGILKTTILLVAVAGLLLYFSRPYALETWYVNFKYSPKGLNIGMQRSEVESIFGKFHCDWVNPNPETGAMCDASDVKPIEMRGRLYRLYVTFKDNQVSGFRWWWGFYAT